VADAERRERVDERVGDRRQGADIAGFACSLTPKSGFRLYVIRKSS
jgi:hypothetical protein